MYKSKFLEAFAEVKEVKNPDKERQISDTVSDLTGSICAVFVGIIISLIFILSTVHELVLKFIYKEEISFILSSVLFVATLFLFLIGKYGSKSTLKKLFYLLSNKPYEARFTYHSFFVIKVCVEANLVQEGGHVIKGKGQHITAYLDMRAEVKTIVKTLMDIVKQSEETFK